MKKEIILSKKKNATRFLFQKDKKHSDEDEEIEDAMSLHDESSDEEYVEPEEDVCDFDPSYLPKINDYVLVKEGCSKKSAIFSVGKIVSENDEEYEILHLKPTKKGNFVETGNKYTFLKKQVELKKLPNPTALGKTSRTSEMLSFAISFENIIIQ